MCTYLPLLLHPLLRANERTDTRWKFHAGEAPESSEDETVPQEIPIAWPLVNAAAANLPMHADLYACMYVRRPAQSPCHRLTPRPR